jgi:hypothetical protein
MTNFNFEGQPEGEWEDRGNLSWSELDWQQFLQRRDKDISRFLKFYDECPLGPTERLDWVARQMSWDTEDWSVGDFPEDEDESDGWKGTSDDLPNSSDTDPYTLHRHPVFVVSTGLFLQMRHILRTALKHKNAPTDALLSWDFSDILNDAERHSLMAMQSMDMGDFMLCLVHLKRALKGINAAMSIVGPLTEEASAGEFFRHALVARMFDLRDVYIRVIQDCRGEDRRNYGE